MSDLFVRVGTTYLSAMGVDAKVRGFARERGAQNRGAGRAIEAGMRRSCRTCRIYLAAPRRNQMTGEANDGGVVTLLKL